MYVCGWLKTVTAQSEVTTLTSLNFIYWCPDAHVHVYTLCDSEMLLM